MRIIQGQIVADEGEHVVLTGPIQGTVTTEDGREVDVTAPAVVASSPEEALQIANAIGEYWASPDTPTHPDLVEVGEDGQVRDVEFVHDAEQSAENMRAATGGQNQEA